MGWCILCGACKEVCSTEAIRIAYAGYEGHESAKNILISIDECICCGSCYSACPTGGIMYTLDPYCEIGSGDGGYFPEFPPGEWGGSEGGGGGSGSVMTGMISKKNSLNTVDRKKLEETLSKLLEQCGYSAMSSFLTSKGAKLDNITIDSSIGGDAHYDPWENILSFKYSSKISTAFTEEFVHFFQHNYYSEGITPYNNAGRSNIEFEAKLIMDILCEVKGLGCAYYGRGKNHANVYDIWLMDITRDGTYIPNYNDLLVRSGKWDNLNYWDFLEDFATSSISYNYPIKNNLAPSAINFLNSTGCD